MYLRSQLIPLANGLQLPDFRTWIYILVWVFYAIFHMKINEIANILYMLHAHVNVSAN